MSTYFKCFIYLRLVSSLTVVSVLWNRIESGATIFLVATPKVFNLFLG